MPRDVQAPEVEKVDRWGENAINEKHPAFGLIQASRGTSMGGGGAVLFDSDITHQSTITITIREAERDRALNHDRIHPSSGRAEGILAEVDLSEAQWASFIATMNTGYGVPCTIRKKHGVWDIPGLPYEPRLQESLDEVRRSGEKAVEKIDEALKAVEEKPTKANIRHLRAMVNNAPGNMTHAAKSLEEHAENVVTRAQHDIESAVAQAAERRGLDPSELGVPQLTAGEENEPVEAEVVEDG